MTVLNTDDLFNVTEEEPRVPKVMINLPLNQEGGFENIGPISALNFIAEKRNADAIINAIPEDKVDHFLEELAFNTAKFASEMEKEGSENELAEEFAAKIVTTKSEEEPNDTNVVSIDNPESKFVRATDCYNAKQTARVMGIEQRLLYTDAWREALGAFQISANGSAKGTKVYFPKANVKAYLENLKN